MRERDNEPMVTFERVRVKRCTDAAMLCHIDGNDVWVPKSQCDFNASDVSEEGDIGQLVMTEWIATAKGLV